MALNWEYIKGFNSSAGTSFKYSWLNFADETSNNDNSLDAPILWLGTTNNFNTSNLTKYGNLLISDKNNLLLDNYFIWRYISGSTERKTVGIRGHYTSSTPTFSIYSYSGDVASSIADFKSDAITLNKPINATGKLTVTGNAEFSGQIKSLADIYATTKIYSGTYIEAKNYVIASYFNATSDMRAKINIKPITISALPIVKQMNLYSYTYKDTNIQSIGMLAQDIDWTINDFDLVQNREATGQNGDYMAIHESKLVFVLWKAVQELSTEVDELRKQLKKLN